MKMQKTSDCGYTQIDAYIHNTTSTHKIGGTQKSGKKEFKGICYEIVPFI